jgi:hypothetical protein
MTVLLIQDKLGITEGYKPAFNELVQGAGFWPSAFRFCSAWRSPLAKKFTLLTRKGNRKAPGPNPEIKDVLANWLWANVKIHKPDLIICMDPAFLGLVEDSWDIATIDNMRGGVYDFGGIPFIVVPPISAINTQKKPKDIRAMNDGAESEDEFNADNDEDFFVEPYTIPYGERILGADLRKAWRVYSRVQAGNGKRLWTPEVGGIRLVQGKGDAEEATDYFRECMLASNDVETLPDLMLMNVVGWSGLHSVTSEIRTYVFPFYRAKSPQAGTPTDLHDYLKACKRINDFELPMTYHNGPYDLFWLARYGMTPRNYAFDSMTMFWSIFPEYPKTLAFVSSILLDDHQYWKGDRKSDSWETYLLYNGKDCDRTLRCTLRLIDLLSRSPAQARNFIDAHIRVINGVHMSVRGMRADLVRRAEHGVTLAKDTETRLRRLRHIIADSEFNPNSPAQKSRLLYQLLGAKPRSAKGRFVKKIEDASTGAVAMRAMRNEHPVVGIVVNALMETMEPAKQTSNLIKMKVAEWDNGPRFYTNYGGVGTTTTRFGSSRAPINVGGNAQNFRKTYRDWLVADSDSFLLDIDFSAADDVFVSFESGDPRKIELFRSGRDTHSQNATLFFENWTYQQVVDGKKAKDDRVVHPITGIRQITKKLSHGCNYLMAGLTLLMTAGREAIVAAAKEVGYSDAGLWNQEALAEFCVSRELLYRGYYTRFAREGKDSWYSDLWREFQDTGGFTTPFGYFQRFLSSRHDKNVLRGLAATAGQAGTAGRINMAMDELIHGIIRPEFRDAPNPHYGQTPRRVTVREHGIDLRLQSHDSLTFNVKFTHPNWQEGVAHIYESMGRPVVIRNKLTGGLEEFRIGLESEAGFGWGPGLHEVKGNSLEAVKITLDKILAERQLTHLKQPMLLTTNPKE